MILKKMNENVTAHSDSKVASFHAKFSIFYQKLKLYSSKMYMSMATEKVKVVSLRKIKVEGVATTF